MNLGEIISRVQRQFGDESGAQITVADITNWANDGQTDIVRKTECLQIHAETDSIAQDGSYTLPLPFIRLRRVSYNGVKLQRVELETLDKVAGAREFSQPVGTPDRFYLWGQRLWIYPAPDKDGTGNLDIYYIKRPDTLTGPSSIPEIPVHMHEDIIRFCLARAKELDQEDEKSAQLMADYENRVSFSRDETLNPETDSYPSIRSVESDLGYDSIGYGGGW